MPTWSDPHSPKPRAYTAARAADRPRCLFTLVLTVLALSRPGVPARERGPTVVILSLDGIRHDFPDRIAGGAFARLAKEGVRASRLEPPFPASTFPSHASLGTGCYPERHGILNSRFRDGRRGEFDRSPDPDWLHCEPIWVNAQRHGIPSAVSNWVGSYGPWRGTEAAYHDEFFRERPDRESVRRILRWLRLPGRSRPRLILAYLSGTDHAGHRYGPEAPEVRAQLQAEDRVLSDLLEGMERTSSRGRISLLVISDHGMASRIGTVDPMQVLGRRGIRNLTLMSGGSANIYLAHKGDLHRAAALLGSVSGMEVFLEGRLPASLRYEFPGRTGDLVLVAPLGMELGRETGEREPNGRGVHGYRGTEGAMGGIFYGWGAGIRSGSTVGTVRAVDVYSLACKLLGIMPSNQAQGRVPPGVLRNP